MFCEEIKKKQDLSYIPICSLRILYNSKFFNDNVTRVHCIPIDTLPIFTYIGLDVRLNGLCQAKLCPQTCAKCTDSDSSRASAVLSGHLFSTDIFHSAQ